MANNFSNNKVITVTATTDAEGIAQNKVVATGIEIPNAVQGNAGCALIKSITISDASNTSLVCDVIFSSSSTVISEDQGKAVGEDVADLDDVVASASGWVQFVAGDHTGLIDARLHTKSGIDLMVEAAEDSKSIYMHIINRGSTATFAATDDVKVKIGLIQ